VIVSVPARSAWITLYDDHERAVRLRSWLPSVLDAGGVEYTLLAPFVALRRPFVLDAVELDAPDLGVAYGQLDEPFRIPVDHDLDAQFILWPALSCWSAIRRFILPRDMQSRGCFRPRRYHVDRRMAWKWLSRVDGRG
jgi:hypothetical protein